MVEIKLEDVTHIYEGGVEAITNINWTIPDGSATGLLGPSGCGKTTLMKIISGLGKQTKGNVYFNGREVSDMTPQERNVCLVFQFPVVYRDMNVRNNLAFPLKNKGTPKQEIEKRVTETAEMLGIKDKLDRSSSKLGPGDKQLVSLGRAIVREETNVVMLDEPLTDVEPDRRLELRRLLKKIQKELETTMIYVTHDQTEALTFADEVAVMRKGKILQYDDRDTLYHNPSHPFIGYFIGSPGMNFLDCSLTNGELDFGEFTLEISEEEESALTEHGTEFQLGIRPEAMEVSPEERKGWIQWKIKLTNFQGNEKAITLRKGDLEMDVVVPVPTNLGKGDNLWVNFPKENRKMYSSGGSLLIS